jgi:hypothetical protein
LAPLLLAVAGLSVPVLPADPYPDGTALIRAMHDRYQGKWYRTLTFRQTTTNYRAKTVETWWEAARIPGMLRIDIEPLDSGKAILFRNDSIYQFQGGMRKDSSAFVHPLMVLGFDVYADPPERTLAKLQDLGFDLSRIREDTWQGRPVYVVGAAAGDSTSKQFWVDRERLLFVRMLGPARNGSGAIVETQFNRYQPLGKGWISVEVLFQVNGQPVTKEEYAEVKGDTPLPDELFDPGRYGRPGWVH